MFFPEPAVPCKTIHQSWYFLCEAETGVSVHVTNISRVLHRAGLYGRKKKTLHFSVTKEAIISISKSTHLSTPRTDQQGLENCLEPRGRWKELNTGICLSKTCFSLSAMWNWDRGSAFSNTMTQSILLKHHSSGLMEHFKCIGKV